MLNIKTQDSIVTDLPNSSESEAPTRQADRAEASGRVGTSRVYTGMWGKAEIVAVTVAGVLVIASIIVFATVVMPAKSNLESVRSGKIQLEQKVVEAREKYGKINSTTEQVSRLVASANSFEVNYLPADAVGQTALYQRLNSLIATHRLLNTAGPEYTPLPVLGTAGSQSEEGETGRERYRSIFPGVYVTMTVDGAYQDIRRFISDIETSEQFVIISAVGIEPAEQRRKREAESSDVAGAPNMPGIPRPMSSNMAPPAPKAKGESVSLKIELAAYFRRMAGQ